MMSSVMRHERLVYLNCGEGYNLLGEGVTDATVAANAKTAEKQFIHQRMASSGLSGYAPVLSFTAEMQTADLAMLYLQELADNLDYGVNAHTDIVIVDTWKKGNEEGAFAARKIPVVISFDNPGSSAAGVELAITGSMTYEGELTVGQWDPKTKEFTESVASN